LAASAYAQRHTSPRREAHLPLATSALGVDEPDVKRCFLPDAAGIRKVAAMRRSQRVRIVV